MENLFQWIQNGLLSLSTANVAELLATSTTSFLLIFAAEIGDKSQLVCMTLALRHRAFPVVLGAVAAFTLLNSLAVVFGAAIANWFPQYIVSVTVGLLFLGFGIHALRIEDEDEDEDEDECVVEKTGHSIFLTTFLMITVAEFGDKTQLAVVALSSTSSMIAVWVGATGALVFTSVLGVIAGRTILQKMPLTLLHKISGLIFIVLALLAFYQTYQLFEVLEFFRVLLP